MKCLLKQSQKLNCWNTPLMDLFYKIDLDALIKIFWNHYPQQSYWKITSLPSGIWDEYLQDLILRTSSLINVFELILSSIR